MKKRVANVVLAAASTLLALVAVELASYAVLRLTPESFEPFKHIQWMRHSFHPLWTAQEDQYGFWPYVGHFYKPQWKTAPKDLPRLFPEGYVYSDPFGRLLPLEKPARELRVFVLGGSTVAGVGASSAVTAIPDRLELRLRALLPKNSGWTIRVINAGVQGYNSTQEQVLLSTRLLAFSPDLFVVFDGYNDFSDFWYAPNLPPFWNSYDKHLYESFDRVQTTKGLLAQLGFLASKRLYCLAIPRAIRHYARLKAGTAPAEGAASLPAGFDVEKPLRVYGFNQRTMLGAARGQDIPLLAVLQPTLAVDKSKVTPYEKGKLDITEGRGNSGWTAALRRYYEAARLLNKSLAAKNPGRVLDLSRMFVDRSDELYSDHCHYNDTAADAIAVALARPAYAALKTRAKGL